MGGCIPRMAGIVGKSQRLIGRAMARPKGVMRELGAAG